MEKVTVIIPVYNVERYVKKCIESVCNQTYSNLEIILVDDGSIDNSGKYCDDAKLQDKRIKVIHKVNEGLSSARNAGLDIATGKYIYFLDSDDFIENNLIEINVKLMEEGYDLVIFNYKIVDEKGKILGHSSIRKMKWNFLNDNDRIKFLFKEFFPFNVRCEVWNRFYSRNIIEKHNLRFADNYKIFAEDMYFFLCYLSFTNKIYSCGEILHNYLIRNDSIMRTNNDYMFNLNRINNLSQTLKEFYIKHEECKCFLKIYPLIHYFILKTHICIVRKNGISLRDLGIFFRDKMENSAFCMEEFNCFIKNYEKYYYLKNKIEILEIRNVLKYYQNLNYIQLWFSNKWLLFVTKIKQKNVE